MQETIPCSLCCSATSFFKEVEARRFFICSVCRLVFLDPEQRLSAPEELGRYRLHQNHPQDAGYRTFLNQLLEPLAPHLMPKASGLDYGCGPGPVLAMMLKERGFMMELFDPYFFPDTAVLKNVYDFITCSEAMEHFFNPRKELDQWDQILKKGGWLAVLTQMRESQPVFEKWHYIKDPTHVSFYSRETMDWIAFQYGWKKFFPSQNVTLFHKIGL